MSYELEAEVGRGGMAVVHAGRDTKLGRPVALKVLAAHLADNDEFRARFLREARIAARLAHPNLVRTFDVTEVDGLPCIVMELLPGRTLEGDTLSRAEAADVAAALAYAHEQGVVHRDLKPGNLLRTADGTVKIADFGIARAAEETMVTQTGTILGTLRYLAPEQAAGLVAGPEADVYSLGVVLDELLEAPSADDRALIARCLEHAPKRRPPAADVAAGLAGRTSPEAVTRVLPRPRRRRVLLAALVVALVAAAASLAVALPSRGGGTPRIAPVPHGATLAQQARNLERWLERYSR